MGTKLLKINFSKLYLGNLMSSTRLEASSFTLMRIGREDFSIKQDIKQGLIRNL